MTLPYFTRYNYPNMAKDEKTLISSMCRRQNIMRKKDAKGPYKIFLTFFAFTLDIYL